VKRLEKYKAWYNREKGKKHRWARNSCKGRGGTASMEPAARAPVVTVAVWALTRMERRKKETTEETRAGKTTAAVTEGGPRGVGEGWRARSCSGQERGPTQSTIRFDLWHAIGSAAGSQK